MNAALLTTGRRMLARAALVIEADARDVCALRNVRLPVADLRRFALAHALAARVCLEEIADGTDGRYTADERAQARAGLEELQAVAYPTRKDNR